MGSGRGGPANRRLAHRESSPRHAPSKPSLGRAAGQTFAFSQASGHSFPQVPRFSSRVHSLRKMKPRRPPDAPQPVQAVIARHAAIAKAARRRACVIGTEPPPPVMAAVCAAPAGGSRSPPFKMASAGSCRNIRNNRYSLPDRLLTAACAPRPAGLHSVHFGPQRVPLVPVPKPLLSPPWRCCATPSKEALRVWAVVNSGLLAEKSGKPIDKRCRLGKAEGCVGTEIYPWPSAWTSYSCVFRAILILASLSPDRSFYRRPQIGPAAARFLLGSRRSR